LDFGDGISAWTSTKFVVGLVLGLFLVFSSLSAVLGLGEGR